MPQPCNKTSSSFAPATKNPSAATKIADVKTTFSRLESEVLLVFGSLLIRHEIEGANGYLNARNFARRLPASTRASR